MKNFLRKFIGNKLNIKSSYVGISSFIDDGTNIKIKAIFPYSSQITIQDMEVSKKDIMDFKESRYHHEPIVMA